MLNNSNQNIRNSSLDNLNNLHEAISREKSNNYNQRKSPMKASKINLECGFTNNINNTYANQIAAMGYHPGFCQINTSGLAQGIKNPKLNINPTNPMFNNTCDLSRQRTNISENSQSTICSDMLNITSQAPSFIIMDQSFQNQNYQNKSFQNPNPNNSNLFFNNNPNQQFNQRILIPMLSSRLKTLLFSLKSVFPSVVP